MKAILVGYGAMGRRLHERASVYGIEVLASVDPKHPDATHHSLSEVALSETDVVIDFTSPDTVMDNIKMYASSGASVVMGTTGWYGQHEQVKTLAEESGQRFLWASNYSIGVNLFFNLTEAAARWFDAFDEYDVWGYEVHHNKKADSPSGTAITLTEILLSQLKRKEQAVFDRLEGAIRPEELHFASIRGGQSNFEHTVAFDSEADCVTIRHDARNRDGYVDGALRAAAWLPTQQPGFYSLSDFLSTLLKQS